MRVVVLWIYVPILLCGLTNEKHTKRDHAGVVSLLVIVVDPDCSYLQMYIKPRITFEVLHL